MYLTAQRVRDAAGEEGINAFLYVHADIVIPGLDWERPDVAVVAEHPGTLALQLLDLNPGGNRVLSFLDVAIADALFPRAVELLANTTEPDGEPDQPLSSQDGPLSLRFYASLPTRADHDDEFELLRDRLLMALGSARPRTMVADAQRAPLSVRVDHDDVGIRYVLDPVDVERVRRVHPQAGPARSLGVTHETRSALVRAVDDLDAEIAVALTGLSREHLAALGGVQFIDAADGRVLRELDA